MNPFATVDTFFSPISEILEKIANSNNKYQALHELKIFIAKNKPWAYTTSIIITLKPLFSHIDNTIRRIINEILYSIPKQIFIKTVKTALCEWMYNNIGTCDLFAEKILNEYIDINLIGDTLSNFLKYKNYKDLQVFIYLIKNSEKEYWFNINDFELKSDIDFTLIYEILNIIQDKLLANYGDLKFFDQKKNKLDQINFIIKNIDITDYLKNQKYIYNSKNEYTEDKKQINKKTKLNKKSFLNNFKENNMEITKESFIIINKENKNEINNKNIENSNFLKLFFGIFYKVKKIIEPIFINQKYKILFDFYNYVDESIYNESKYFTVDTFIKLVNTSNSIIIKENNILINDRVVYENLNFTKYSQIRVVKNKIKDKESFLIKNKNKNINIIDACIDLQISSDFLRKFYNEISDCIKFAIDDIYKKKNCIIETNKNNFLKKNAYLNAKISSLNINRDKLCSDKCDQNSFLTNTIIKIDINSENSDNGINSENSNDINTIISEESKDLKYLCKENIKKKELEFIIDIFDLLEGKQKILAAFLCGKKLSPKEFDKKNIESVFECAIKVFPLNYFISNEFDCSSIPLIKEYKNIRIEDVFELYKNTKLEDALPFFEDIEIIKTKVLALGKKKGFDIFLASGIKDKNIQFKNRDNIWLAFYFLLPKYIIRPERINYDIVLEYFFNLDFLKLIQSEASDKKEFNNAVLRFIGKINVNNTIYHTGYNFDDDINLFNNVSKPQNNEIFRHLYTIYKTIVNSNENIIESNKEENQDKYNLFYQEVCILHILENIICIVGNIKYINKLKKFITQEMNVFKFLGENFYFFEKLRRHVFEELAVINNKTLLINENKAKDVILRNFEFDYLLEVKAKWLSLSSLENIISRFDYGSQNFISSKNFSIILNNTKLFNFFFNNLKKTNNIKKYISENIELYDDLYSKISQERVFDYFIKLFDEDTILLDPFFRKERIKLYELMILHIAKQAADSITTCYNTSKLDYSSNDNAIFEMILSFFTYSVNSFWCILSKAIYLLSSIDIAIFIENCIIGFYTESNLDSNILNQKPNLLDYLNYCTNNELSLFAFAFPRLFKLFSLKRNIKIYDMLLNEVKNVSIKNNLRLSQLPDYYKLEMIYNFDSASYVANIIIPKTFPYKMPRIEFDYKSIKCPHFYLKLNELLTKTTKFSEVFISWEANLDSRFAGHKECLICYYILDVKTRALAEFSCFNCKNKFHKDCILKWFNTSKERLCPFCRVKIY